VSEEKTFRRILTSTEMQPKKQMLEQVCNSMNTEGYDVCSVKVKSKDNGEHETLHIRDKKIPKPISVKLCESLLVKD